MLLYQSFSLLLAKVNIRFSHHFFLRSLRYIVCKYLWSSVKMVYQLNVKLNCDVYVGSQIELDFVYE